MSWPEFIEAGFLTQYRIRQVTLQQLRPVIERMRREFGAPYPLAHFRPTVDHSARKLVLRVQDEENLDDRLAIVRLHDGQLQVGEAIEPFLEQVDFDGAVAARWELSLEAVDAALRYELLLEHERVA